MRARERERETERVREGRGGGGTHVPNFILLVLTITRDITTTPGSMQRVKHFT